MYRFGRYIFDLCIIPYHILDHIYDQFAKLLQDFDPNKNPVLQPVKLELYCQAITEGHHCKIVLVS